MFSQLCVEPKAQPHLLTSSRSPPNWTPSQSQSGSRLPWLLSAETHLTALGLCAGGEGGKGRPLSNQTENQKTFVVEQFT